jgi:hypothetical protein
MLTTSPARRLPNDSRQTNLWGTSPPSLLNSTGWIRSMFEMNYGAKIQWPFKILGRKEVLQKNVEQ